MVGYYRLNGFGFRLASGSHVLRQADFAPVATANDLVAAAEARAAAILAEAEAAYEREKMRGYADGMETARLESVERLLEESRVLERSLADMENDLARLVTASVRRIVESFDDATRAEAVVHFALKQMRREKKAEIRVPKALYEHFRARVGAITAEFPEVELIDVVEDGSLGPSQIVVETSIGRVDGNLAERLDDLETLIRSTHARAALDRLDAAAQMAEMQGDPATP